MTESLNILPLQIKKIHIAKSQIGLSDEQYRSTLSGFVNQYDQPVSSCKELTYDQAEALLNIFKKLGFKEKRNGKVKKYEEYAGRDSKFATPGQLRKIDGLWFHSPNVREKNEEAMHNFVHRIASVDRIWFLLKLDVNKVIRAIEAL